MKMSLSSGLFTVDQLPQNDVNNLLEKAKHLSGRFPTHRGSTVRGQMINVFFEPSTRTRLSFETAAANIGVKSYNFHSNSAMEKGEGVLDTLLTIDVMYFDIVVLRTKTNNLPYNMSQYLDAKIINAGDGTNEHPTQALGDLYTIQKHGFDNSSTVAIVGDLVHSRVAKSNTKLLLNMGYNVILVAPQQWMPNLNHWDILKYEDKVTFSNSIDSIKDANVVMALRIQGERQDKSNLIDLKQYNEQYGIKNHRLNNDQILMHPGPVNRGVEIDDDMLYGTNSVILEQVKNGIVVRAAILDTMLGIKK